MRRLLAAIFLLVSVLVWGQDTLKISEEKWREEIENLSYEDADPETPDAPSEFEFKESNPTDTSQFAWLMFAIIIAALVVVLLIILRKNIMQRGSVKKPRTAASSLEEAEEKLPEVELQGLYKALLDQGDYRKALRVRFLMLLQALLDQGEIRWKPRKTNEQFAREINRIDLKVSFAYVAQNFDESWYGTREVTRELFGELVAEMDGINLRKPGKNE